MNCHACFVLLGVFAEDVGVEIIDTFEACFSYSRLSAEAPVVVDEA